MKVIARAGEEFTSPKTLTVIAGQEFSIDVEFIGRTGPVSALDAVIYKQPGGGDVTTTIIPAETFTINGISASFATLKSFTAGLIYLAVWQVTIDGNVEKIKTLLHVKAASKS